MSDAVTSAILHKQTWKRPEMDQYARALLTEARRLYLIERVVYFNNDDVPELSQPGDGKTVGLVVKLLTHEKIIEPYRGSHPELEIWGGMRRSTRRCNNGHRNQLYKIRSMALLETWLDRHGGFGGEQQGRLF